MSDTIDMPCPMCGNEIEVEYDEDSIHAVLGGCPHALQWTESKLSEGDKYELDRRIWQIIEDCWVDRAEAAQEAHWESQQDR